MSTILAQMFPPWEKYTKIAAHKKIWSLLVYLTKSLSHSLIKKKTKNPGKLNLNKKKKSNIRAMDNLHKYNGKSTTEDYFVKHNSKRVWLKLRNCTLRLHLMSVFVLKKTVLQKWRLKYCNFFLKKSLRGNSFGREFVIEWRIGTLYVSRITGWIDPSWKWGHTP